ncbi:MAG: glycosyltransferase family 2 protein [Mesorhizobium sp.]|nr:MAG: glycosyltransferase family 2 protein [Mesorhizobium sp.]
MATFRHLPYGLTADRASQHGRLSLGGKGRLRPHSTRQARVPSVTVLPNSFPAAQGAGATPRLAVVIPARNRRGSLPRTLASVLSDPRPDIELVVVDDGSEDDTEAYLASLADPRLAWRRLPVPSGANRARNEGAALTSAPLIAFLDSDDAFCPGRIERLIAFFDANPDVACTIDGFMDVADRRQRLHRLPDPTPDAERLRRLLLCHCVPLTNSTVTVRRSAFASIGGYDDGLYRHQDREFLVRLGRQHRIAFGKAVDVLKYREANSMSRTHAGYIAGLSDFVARCEDYQTPDYATILSYLTLRGVLKALAQGSFGVALAEIMAWRRASNLPGGFGAVTGYFAGRRQRRQLEQSLSQAATTSAE